MTHILYCVTVSYPLFIKMKKNYLLKCLNLFNLLPLMVNLLLLILLFNYIFTIYTGSVEFHFLSSGVEGLILFSLVPVKPKSRLSKSEREKFVLPEDLKSILVGLLLGDLYGQIQTTGVNARFRFEQSIVHEDYLLHLYALFQSFSVQAPKVNARLPHRQTGKIYSNMYFITYSLPCFNELYSLFYLDGKKVIPSNIGDLLTPLGCKK
jgi:hypothetical protein